MEDEMVVLESGEPSAMDDERPVADESVSRIGSSEPKEFPATTDEAKVVKLEAASTSNPLAADEFYETSPLESDDGAKKPPAADENVSLPSYLWVAAVVFFVLLAVVASKVWHLESRVDVVENKLVSGESVRIAAALGRAGADIRAAKEALSGEDAEKLLMVEALLNEVSASVDPAKRGESK